MANTLTTSATLVCPHGGTVSIVSTNQRVKAGAPVARASDTFTISGCTFQRPLPGGAQPSPCVSVKWLVTDVRVKAQDQYTLSTASTGVCLAGDQVPQGNVMIQSTQTKASST